MGIRLGKIAWGFRYGDLAQRDVMTAICFAAPSGTADVIISKQDVSEASQRHPDTVKLALNALRAAGYLSYQSRMGRNAAYVVHLERPSSPGLRPGFDAQKRGDLTLYEKVLMSGLTPDINDELNSGATPDISESETGSQTPVLHRTLTSGEESGNSGLTPDIRELNSGLTPDIPRVEDILSSFDSVLKNKSITLDISVLTQKQKEQISGYITSAPASETPDFSKKNSSLLSPNSSHKNTLVLPSTFNSEIFVENLRLLWPRKSPNYRVGVAFLAAAEMLIQPGQRFDNKTAVEVFEFLADRTRRWVELHNEWPARERRSRKYKNLENWLDSGSYLEDEDELWRYHPDTHGETYGERKQRNTLEAIDTTIRRFEAEAAHAGAGTAGAHNGHRSPAGALGGDGEVHGRPAGVEGRGGPMAVADGHGGTRDISRRAELLPPGKPDSPINVVMREWLDS